MFVMMLAGQVVTSGALVTATVWLHTALLLQQSKAAQVRVMNCGQAPLVTVLRMTTRTLVQQASATVGGLKLHAEPRKTALLAGQVRCGGVVSTTVTVWVQVE